MLNVFSQMNSHVAFGMLYDSAQQVSQLSAGKLQDAI